MTLVAELTTRTAEDQVALHGVRLSGRVLGTHQQITLEQTYINLEDRAIEAQYTFPLPANATVCEFEVRTGDRTLRGEIDENTNNAKLYEDALEQGDGAFLLEQQRPDIFTAWVGNIKPQQAATIRITYLAPVEVIERAFRLRFPTTVSPRFVTSTGGRDPLETAIDGIAVNPPHVLHVPYGVEFLLDLEPGAPIREVSSPSHELVISQHGHAGKRVAMSDNITQMDRDIVIDVELDQAAQPSGRVCRTEDDETFVTINFIPEFEEPAPATSTETVFLIDTSGSMGGSSLEEAKQALRLCLRSLSSGDYFNIVSFNSGFETFQAQAIAYDAESLEQALTWVDGLCSTGGTELYYPLQHVVPHPPSVGSVRQVILLTDGQVANEDQVIRLADSHRQTNRVFTFAIGHGASQHLTGGLARATGGANETIVPGERIEEKVLRTFARLGTPIVENIQVDWGPGVKQVEQAPSEILSVFEGDPLTVFARMKDAPREVTLSCERGGKTDRWKVVVEPTTEHELLSRCWAREAIRELSLGDSAASVDQRQRVKRRSRREQMVDLSCRYQVLCEHTSFLAIETRADAERTEGQPEQRRIPVQLTAGWGGVDMSMRGTRGQCGFGGARLAEGLAVDTPRGFSAGFASLHAKAPPSAPATPQLAPITLLLDLQQADGHFDWNQEASDLLFDMGGIAPGVESALSKAVTATVGPDGDDDLLHTLLVLAVLRYHFQDQRSLWKRAAAKAERWLDGRLPRAEWEAAVPVFA